MFEKNKNLDSQTSEFATKQQQKYIDKLGKSESINLLIILYWLRVIQKSISE